MIINRDNSAERSATANGLYKLIGIIESGVPYVQGVLRAEFPNVATATEVPVNAAPSPQAITGAGNAVNLAISDEQRMQVERARLENEAQLKIRGAYAAPGPVTATASANNYPPRHGQTTTLSPEQTQFISQSQENVKRALDEPLA